VSFFFKHERKPLACLYKIPEEGSSFEIHFTFHIDIEQKFCLFVALKIKNIIKEM